MLKKYRTTRIFCFMILLASVNAVSQSHSEYLVENRNFYSTPEKPLPVVAKDVSNSESKIDTILSLQMQMNKELRNQMFLKDKPTL